MPQFDATARAANLPSTAMGNITGTANMFVDSGGTNILVLPLEGSNILKNRMFRVMVAGHAKSGTTSTLTVSAYITTGTPSATVANNGTAWMATSATSLASTNQNFFLIAELMYDSVSQKIEGIFRGQIANTYVTQAAVTATSLVSLDLSKEATYYFSLSGLFGTSDAGNSCTIDAFELSPM